jgi:acyl-CoA dehydrogenase
MDTSTQDLLGESAAALFTDLATPAAVRVAEEKGVDPVLWQAVADSGFDLALVPEALGGSGLCLRDTGALLEAIGRFAVPLPLGEAMLAHALAAASGVLLPSGSLSAALARREGETLKAQAVPYGATVTHVLLVVQREAAWLMPASLAQRDAHAGLTPCMECDMAWPRSQALQRIALPEGCDWMAAGAALRSAQIAGALDAVLAKTLIYAEERQQFGRGLAKFQAIQQQIAVLAEDCFAAGTAAALACDSSSPWPEPALAAAAKVVASQAASRASGIAHAIFGAMGITGEHDLQLFTRRLQSWRTQYGSEDFWSERLGHALLAGSGSTWDYARRPEMPVVVV